MKVFVLSVFSLFALSMEAVSDPVPFEFNKTVAIYHLTQDGGIIYTRPSEYNEAQGFIVMYEAMDQYLGELGNPSSNTFLHPDEQPVLEEFLLVNGATTKTYFLKEGWLGDGEQWVPMNQDDYAKLTDMIAHRKDLAGSRTSTEGLEEFTSQIHQAARENETLEFDKMFDFADQEMEEAPLESNGKKSSNASNTSEMKEIMQDSGDSQSKGANLTEISSERIAKSRLVRNDNEILEEVEIHSNTPAQEKGMQVDEPTYLWKWTAICVFLISSILLFFRRKR